MKTSINAHAGSFFIGASFTLFTGIFHMALGLVAAIILARYLGPEGKGIVALALIVPSLATQLISLGIGPATAYYTARREYGLKDIYWNNIVLTFFQSIIGLSLTLLLIVLFGTYLFPSVDKIYFVVALILIPIGLFTGNFRYILLGTQKVIEYNLVDIINAGFYLASLLIFMLLIAKSVGAAVAATIFASSIACIFALTRSYKASQGTSFKLNTSYIKKSIKYGLQNQLSMVLMLLNYRADFILISYYLGASAVGYYTISVSLTEKLWLISHAFSTALFPRIAADVREKERKELTPFVARTVLVITSFGAIVLFFISSWLVELLFSDTFLPSIAPLQILLIGTVVYSVARVLANDISGRGFPIYNSYVSLIAASINVLLNIMFIPRYGISGAAWASSISYSVSLAGELIIYCRLSGNKLHDVLVPNCRDFKSYARTLRNISKH